MGERSVERLHNQYRYSVHTGAGQMLAATISAAPIGQITLPT